MQRKRKACRYVGIAERAYEDCQGKLEKGYSEELPDDNADFTDRGAPLKQHDPTYARAPGLRE